MSARIVLKIIAGKLKGKEYPFSERSVCIIGRGPDANIRLPDDAAHRTISRYHCLLDINPPAVRVRDFGSRNGTFVNGEKIGQRDRTLSAREGARVKFSEHDLEDGDTIKLGSTVFQVDVEQALIPATSERTKKPPPQRPVCVDEDERTVFDSQFPIDDPQAVRSQDLLELSLDRSQQRSLPSLSGASHDVSQLAAIQGYDIIRELGRGGMGAVYLARNQKTGEKVALKLMLPRSASNEMARNLFHREIQTTKCLKHVNIVGLKEFMPHEDHFFFTLEYCDGGSVDDLMEKRGGKLPLAEGIDITLQALEGLAYAHSAEIDEVVLASGGLADGHGLVHRDLKPANIFLSGSGSKRIAKVADFGLAKSFDLAGLSGQTATGTICGTPFFMPRQLVLNFKYAQPDADVWAMAASFYNMVTGETPRDFYEDQDPWLTILKNECVPIRKRDPAIPRPLAEVIDTALVDSPKILIKTARELQKAIREAC